MEGGYPSLYKASGPAKPGTDPEEPMRSVEDLAVSEHGSPNAADASTAAAILLRPEGSVATVSTSREGTAPL